MERSRLLTTYFLFLGVGLAFTSVADWHWSWRIFTPLGYCLSVLAAICIFVELADLS